MTTPANDLFANARFIYDAIQFGDTTSGATLETGEDSTNFPVYVTVGLKSVWYQWTAPANTSVTFTLSATNISKHSISIWTGSGTGTDSLYTIEESTGAATGLTATFTSTAGVTYYVRVAGKLTTSTTFQLAFPVGRPAGTLRAEGTNDLPTLLIGRTRSSARTKIMEAVGYGPDSERITSRIDLLPKDEHSNSSFLSSLFLVRNSDNSPVHSCERWVRLRFEPPFGAIINLRFWINNLDPDVGWQIRYGLTDKFRKPSTSASNIATAPVPSVDPGGYNMGAPILSGGQVRYSPWLVLQAVWIGGTPGKLQADQLNWEFDWSEM